MNTKEFYDLHVHSENFESIEKTIKFSEKLGWSGICLVDYFPKNKKDFKVFSEKVFELREKSKIKILIGAEISSEIKKNSRNALNFADLILVKGSDENINREASECWEVDILSHPESQLDHITAKLLAEKGIHLEINFSEVLHCRGFFRAQKIFKIKKNIKLARKYKVPMILASGAKNDFSLRAPRDLIAFGKTIGMNELEIKNALEKNPLNLIKKSKDRSDSKVIMKGLEISEFGSEEKKQKKRKFGWY